MRERESKRERESMTLTLPPPNVRREKSESDVRSSFTLSILPFTGTQFSCVVQLPLHDPSANFTFAVFDVDNERVYRKRLIGLSVISVSDIMSEWRDFHLPRFAQLLSLGYTSESILKRSAKHFQLTNNLNSSMQKKFNSQRVNLKPFISFHDMCVLNPTDFESISGLHPHPYITLSDTTTKGECFSVPVLSFSQYVSHCLLSSLNYKSSVIFLLPFFL